MSSIFQLFKGTSSRCSKNDKSNDGDEEQQDTAMMASASRPRVPVSQWGVTASAACSDMHGERAKGLAECLAFFLVNFLEVSWWRICARARRGGAEAWVPFLVPASAESKAPAL